VTDLLLLVGGLLLLSYAADRFVLGAARLSTALRVSPVLIGALVIGFGTSAPELLVSVLATLRGAQDIAFGNVVGSNTANVLLVLGAAAVFSPLVVGPKTLRRELPLMLAAIFALALVTFDGRVRWWEGALLLLGALLAVAVIVVIALRDREAAAALEAEVAEFEGEQASLPRSAVLALAGLTGTLIGAQMLVSGAVGLSRALGVSEAVVGLTIVAIGTSLPELVTAVAAARQRETDLVVGNILGSNIFNSLLVAGASGALDTVRLDPAFRWSIVAMLVANGLAALLLGSGRRVALGEGVLLLAAFVLFTLLAF
jgi:cation:H+ antiporter